jgi:large subunit ribosomal protein L4
MHVDLLNNEGQVASGFELPDSVFSREYNEGLIHQLVVSYQSNARQGTRAQKTRAEVHHSTKKPFKQKGTGNARAGMTSSPLWRGGGRIFPNRPDENFSKKINKKMFRIGMSCIFSQLARDGRLVVVDSLSVDSPKTRELALRFKKMNVSSALVIADVMDENLYLASRNLVNIAITEPRYADPLSLVHYKKVIVTKAAVEQIEEMYK